VLAARTPSRSTAHLVNRVVMIDPSKRQPTAIPKGSYAPATPYSTETLARLPSSPSKRGRHRLPNARTAPPGLQVTGTKPQRLRDRRIRAEPSTPRQSFGHAGARRSCPDESRKATGTPHHVAIKSGLHRRKAVHHRRPGYLISCRPARHSLCHYFGRLLRPSLR